ncbi:MAG: EAL domain-containing protein [Rhodopseudomonas palustris]|nr:MAG: EAL domain-containing protein [Rhodopseudomonas palustris]
MLKIYTCLAVDHDLRLLVVASAICLFVSTVGVALFNRARAASGRMQLVWLTFVAMSAGFGVWSTHFIAMLAYIPAAQASYDPGLTLVSLALAILVIGAGAAIALVGPSIWYVATGGAVVGLGFAAMHFCGVTAVQRPALMIASPEYASLAATLGVSLSIPAAVIAVRRDDIIHTVIAALLFSLAILSLHFTAMASLAAVPDPDQLTIESSMSAATLALVIAGAAAAILGGCLIAALIDRRSSSVIQRQKMLLDIATENIPQALCMFDAEGRAKLFNTRYAALIDIDPEQLKGMKLTDQFQLRKTRGQFAGDPEATFNAILTDISSGEMVSRTDQSVLPGHVLRIIEQPLPDGGWVATIEDITEWRKTQERMVHLARHDSLTDLPNRFTLREELDRALRYSRRETGVAILYIDLDHFKEINDTLGHPIGDALLIEVGRRLVGCVRGEDTVARLGGDEFAIIQMSHHDPESDAAALAMRIVSVISMPYEIQGHHISIGTSIGIALAPADGSEPDQLIKNADLALYRAKSEGRGGYRFFELDMDAHAQTRRLLTTELRLALARGEFTLRYQPIRDTESNRILCFEALLRWEHPTRGTLLPDQFLDLAEDTGLIIPIGDWVLQTACTDAMQWHSDVGVAVNLSASQFRHPHLVPSVAAALSSSGLEPRRLELEIRESVLLREATTAPATLKALRALGVQLSMDNFGAGYSLLNSLNTFVFDRVKIDRSFIPEIDRSSDALSTLSAVTGLGKRLGRVTAATGVENAEQLRLLRLAGCSEIQGLVVSPPCTAAEMKRLAKHDDRFVA